jgi:branched-chain amino acid transport system substrate-binding protein
MSGLYADNTGVGSVAAATLAVGRGLRGGGQGHESRDRLRRPPEQTDVRSSVASAWFDVDKVDVSVDAPNSGVVLAK